MKVRIGTRGSRLALAQCSLAEQELYKKIPGIEIERVIVSTHGDRVTDRPLSSLGGAGAFAGDIEKALLEGRIDIAVHSAKDLPAVLRQGLTVRAVLEREDPSEVFIFGSGDPFAAVGTGSIRRRAAFGGLYPQAVFKDIRGNVDTRLRKLREGLYSGIILAAAGLRRLGIFDETVNKRVFSPEELLPAPCQGIIALESRMGELEDILKSVDSEQSHFAFDAERAVMELLGGSCSQPVGGYCKMTPGGPELWVTKDGINKASANGYLSPGELAEQAVKML